MESYVEKYFNLGFSMNSIAKASQGIYGQKISLYKVNKIVKQYNLTTDKTRHLSSIGTFACITELYIQFSRRGLSSVDFRIFLSQYGLTYCDILDGIRLIKPIDWVEQGVNPVPYTWDSLKISWSDNQIHETRDP